MGWKIIFAPQAVEELEQIVRFDRASEVLLAPISVLITPRLSRKSAHPSEEIS